MNKTALPSQLLWSLLLDIFKRTLSRNMDNTDMLLSKDAPKLGDKQLVPCLQGSPE